MGLLIQKMRGITPAETNPRRRSGERNEDIRVRHAALVREIEVGLDELDRGACVECKDDAELRGFYDGVKARGRELLSAQKNSAV